MNSQRPSSGSPRKEPQGPRPSPLKICKESQKIRKPAPAIAAVPSMPIINRPQPMIIYMQSPQIIHAEVQDFMTLVQRLTGRSSSSSGTRNSDHSEDLTADHDFTMKNDSNQEIGCRACETEANENGPSAVTSASIVAATSALSPFSPNFLFPSGRLNFSPSVLKDLPLMTPNSDHLFYSPRDFYR